MWLLASDDADDGRDKIRNLAPDVPLSDVLDGAELVKVLARKWVIGLAITPGGLAERLWVELEWPAGYRCRSPRAAIGG